jgi:hypothetical protein
LTGPVIRRLALAAFAIGAVAAGAAWWALSRNTALDWLVAEAVRRSNGALAVEGVEGSLFGPIKVRRILYESRGLRIALEEVAVDAAPRDLAHGRLNVRSLECASPADRGQADGRAGACAGVARPAAAVRVARATVREPSSRDTAPQRDARLRGRRRVPGRARAEGGIG